MNAAIVTRSIAETRDTLVGMPRPLGLVPTMGALHEGHLALVRAAAGQCAGVVVSIFVNPLQFAPDEDLERYPRDESRDLALVTEAGAQAVFAPLPAEMYRPEAATVVHVDGPLGSRYEKASRKVVLQVREGDKVVWEDAQLSRSGLVTVQGRKCVVTATQVGEQVRVDLLEAPAGVARVGN